MGVGFGKSVHTPWCGSPRHAGPGLTAEPANRPCGSTNVQALPCSKSKPPAPETGIAKVNGGGGSTWLSGHDVFPDVFELHFCTGTVPRGPAPRTNVAQLERLATPPEKTRPCSGPTAMCGMGWVEAGGSPALRTLRNSACGGQRNSADQTASVLWIVLGQSPI
jgi:hypothetical protein